MAFLLGFVCLFVFGCCYGCCFGLESSFCPESSKRTYKGIDFSGWLAACHLCGSGRYQLESKALSHPVLSVPLCPVTAEPVITWREGGIARS